MRKKKLIANQSDRGREREVVREGGRDRER